ncbi:MAG: MOP flippase family protein [Candidatus Omnitrophica bacterium]|nr:MOP flippase family protein [Candidatus Omnitrophota bacterium]
MASNNTSNTFMGWEKSQADFGMPTNLRQKTVSGSMWLVGTGIAAQAFQLFITAIIARLLNPQDYGVFGMALILVSFLQVFSQLGTGSAIIQKKDLTEEHLSSIFWLNVITGLILFLIYVASAPFLASFFHTPEVKSIAHVIAINFIITSFSLVQNTILSREMRFRKQSLIGLCSVVVSGIFGVVLATRHFGVWSLVFPSIANSLTTLLLLWTTTSWRPKFMFCATRLKEIINFSFKIFCFDIINYFSRNIQDILIGRYMNSVALGYYSMANRIMLLPLQHFGWKIAAVTFPAYSHIQDDMKRLGSAFTKTLFFLSLVIFPVMTGLMITAREVILVIVGDKWKPVIFLIQILSVAGLIQSLGPVCGTVILARGRSDLYLKMGLYNSFIFCAAIYIGLKFGLNGIAIFYTVATILWCPIVIYITIRLIDLGLGKFLRALLPASISSLIMCYCVLAIKNIFNTNHPIPLPSLLFVAILVGGTTYVGALRLIFPRDFQEALNIIKAERIKTIINS